jgi:hypothetical protein
MNDLLLINDLFIFIKAINYRIKKVKKLTILIIFELISQYLNFNLYRDYKFHKLDKLNLKKNESKMNKIKMK